MATLKWSLNTKGVYSLISSDHRLTVFNHLFPPIIATLQPQTANITAAGAGKFHQNLNWVD